MDTFEKAVTVMEELFAKDCVFALATAQDNRPAVRMLDAFYDGGAFYVVTYAVSGKVKDIEANERVALCSGAHRFSGSAHNIGHPLLVGNAAIREKLIRVFEPWYFKHNNEAHAAMCYVKIEPQDGFFHKDGRGYRVDFGKRTAEEFPFEMDIELPE